MPWARQGHTRQFSRSDAKDVRQRARSPAPSARDRRGKALVWTMLGEKLVVGDNDRESPRVTFSQVGALLDDGSFHFSDIAFFADYERDKGPSPSVIGKPPRQATPQRPNPSV